MAENKETDYPQQLDRVDMMRVEGDLQEVTDIEDESTASQITGFLYFCNLERQKIRDEYPEWNTGEVGKELGRRWNFADAETRSKYVKIAINQRQQCEREMANTQRSQRSCTKTHHQNNEPEKKDTLH